MFSQDFESKMHFFTLMYEMIKVRLCIQANLISTTIQTLFLRK